MHAHIPLPRRAGRWLAPFLMLLPMAAPANEPVRDSLFAPVEQARAEARDADAEQLSPRAWSQGSDALQRAESDFERGRNLDRIRRALDDALEQFGAAASQARRAADTLADVLQARQHARQAEAPRLYPDRWRDAERQLDDTVARLERGNERGIEQRIEDTLERYRQVELTAIEGQLLSRARAEIVQAQGERVDRLAPRTLDRAREFVGQAERLLAENRHERAEPRRLAAAAADEARHARWLAQRIEAATGRGGSVEDALLEYVEQLRRVAAEAAVEPRLDQGPGATGEALVHYIRTLQAQASAAELRAEDAQRRMVSMEEEIRELDEQLGGVARQRSALVQQVEAQDRVRRQFQQLETLFAADEAVVLREGDTVILRLVGLDFASGAAQVDSASEALLDKLAQAANVFPQARLLIEGHTDSAGSAQLNQRLSRERAQAVRSYLMERHGLPGHRLSAEGYGPDRPIASNDTPDGRARNRRIDVSMPTGSR